MTVIINPLTPDYGWNPLLRNGTGGYINLATGQAVKIDALREALDDVVSASKVGMRDVTERLQRGEVSLAEWQIEMMGYTKDAHVAARVSAHGGWQSMTPADWGRAGQDVKAQYKYLRDYAGQIADGKQPVNGQAIQRSQMYADSSRRTFEKERTRIARDVGKFTEERRVLGAIDEGNCNNSSSKKHGSRPGCVELAAKGWQEIDSLPEIGDATCWTNCRCKFEYRKPNPKKKGDWITSE